jgi:hypothetical protein
MMMMLMMMLMMVVVLVLLVLLLLLLLVDKLHLDPPTARRHRLDRRTLPVAEVRVMVSTCMPGGSSERHSASSEALSVIRGPQRHERGTQRTCRRGARIGLALVRKPPSAAPALDESDRSGASSESPPAPW